MDWLRRVGRPALPEAPSPEEAVPEPIEGAAPGVAALLGELKAEPTRAVLDLGPASASSLRLYSRYARWIRFADLLGEAWRPRAHGSTAALLRSVPLNPERPYDLVFAWDILDRLFPEDRHHIAEWMSDVSAPNARLHFLVRFSEDAPFRPLRFTLLDVDRIRYDVTSPARLPPSRLLPADVTRLLAPLHITHAFTLRTGFREYVAQRR